MSDYHDHPPIVWIAAIAAVLIALAVVFLAGFWYVGLGPK